MPQPFMWYQKIASVYALSNIHTQTQWWCDTGNLGFSILPEVTQLYRRIQRVNHQPVWLVGDPLYLLSYSQSQTWVLKQYLAYIGLYLKTSVSEIPFKPHIYNKRSHMQVKQKQEIW